MPISSSKPRARQLTLSLCPDPRRACHTQPNIISASDFAHSRTAVYTQLQPISLFLPWTSLIRTPRFTCSSSLLSLPQPSHIRATQSTYSSSPFHYICSELRPFVHHGLHTASVVHYFLTLLIRALRFTRTSSLFLPWTSLNRAPRFTRSSAYYVTTSFPHRRFASNRTPSATSFTRGSYSNIHAWSVHDSSYASMHYDIS